MKDERNTFNINICNNKVPFLNTYNVFEAVVSDKYYSILYFSESSLYVTSLLQDLH